MLDQSSSSALWSPRLRYADITVWMLSSDSSSTYLKHESALRKFILRMNGLRIARRSIHKTSPNVLEKRKRNIFRCCCYCTHSNFLKIKCTLFIDTTDGKGKHREETGIPVIGIWHRPQWATVVNGDQCWNLLYDGRWRMFIHWYFFIGEKMTK